MGGLAECHGHIFMNGQDYRTAAALHRNGPVESDVRAHLAACRDAGITYFRDGGDAWGVSLLAARLAGEYGIRYATPAFAIHRQSRYGSIVGHGYGDLKEYRALVAQAKAAGADFIKLMFSGVLDCVRYGGVSCPPLPGAEIREIVHIAHQEGFPVMAHVNGPQAIRDALEAGTDSIEHGFYMAPDCAKALGSTIWVPTHAAIHAFLGRPGFSDQVVSQALAEQAERLRQAAASGGTIAAGSDSGAVGVPHGAGLLQERALLEEILGGTDVLAQGDRALMERFCPRR